MAAYNLDLGHIIDKMKLAKQYVRNVRYDLLMGKVISVKATDIVWSDIDMKIIVSNNNQEYYVIKIKYFLALLVFISLSVQSKDKLFTIKQIIKDDMWSLAEGKRKGKPLLIRFRSSFRKKVDITKYSKLIKSQMVVQNQFFWYAR